jgi:hypothetical protein
VRKEINRYPCECGHLEKDHAMDMEDGRCWNCKSFSLEHPYIRYNCKAYKQDTLRYLEMQNQPEKDA